MLFIIGIIAIVGGIIAAFVTIGNKTLNSKQRMSTIAIAVVVPYLPSTNTGRANIEMSRDIFDAYFEVGDFAKSQEETEELDGTLLTNEDDLENE